MRQTEAAQRARRASARLASLRACAYRARLVTLRSTLLGKLRSIEIDVLVIGGGINGAVSAACLAARGVKVGLIDAGDFASMTSQESSNLAWGGIKYLEGLEFGLVHKLCVSRNHLIRSYPSTVREIRFLTVHERGFRHGLLKLLMGALLYWLLGHGFTRLPRWLSKASLGEAEPILQLATSDGGMEYSDAYLHDNDARFVWNFVRSAIDYGAIAVNYLRSEGSSYDGGRWTTEVTDVVTGERFTIGSRAIVNACGPLVDAQNRLSDETTAHKHVLSKGIHLIVPRLTEHERVLTFFADDGRLFFVIPMGNRSCIGTTDTRVESHDAKVTDEDRDFVLDNINKRLSLGKPLTRADVIAERCGVRPLVVEASGAKTNDWMQLSRKHAIEVDRKRAHLSIFGGKLTDCLNVGEEVAVALSEVGITQPHPAKRWYGESPDEVRLAFLHRAELMELDALTASSSHELLSRRLWRRYGAHAATLLDEIQADPRMGEVLIKGTEYLRAELYLIAKREMVVELEDFLRRRSKIALVMERARIEQAEGLREACEILFGAEAEAKIARYFRGANGAPLDAHPSASP